MQSLENLILDFEFGEIGKFLKLSLFTVCGKNM